MERTRSLIFPTFGFLAGMCFVFACGEVYLKTFPPKDLRIYLGESAGKGIYRNDPILGFDYKDVESFRSENEARLKEYPPLKTCQPRWLLFGSSFIQAEEMLGDVCTKKCPDDLFFYLKKNETLNLRVAQLRILLAEGVRPSRIVFAMMPLDSAAIGIRPYDSIYVNSQGALTYLAPNWCKSCRLLLAGWLRFSTPIPNVNNYAKQLNSKIPEELNGQHLKLFQEIARLTEIHRVPVTILLIPTHEQITRGVGHVYQDSLTKQASKFGFDVCDARFAFTNIRNKRSLFIPDLHFSSLGNDILFDFLLKHIHERDTR